MITVDTISPALARLAQILREPQPILEKTRAALRTDIAAQIATNRNGWQRLSPAYAKRKLRRFGLQPILVASGRMAGDWQAAGAINGYTLRYMAATPYAKYHETGTRIMPRRPMDYQEGQRSVVQHTTEAIEKAWLTV
jgi:hypothetical protein